ncbi:Ribonuclease E [Alteripontixanthobacter maritimus]|uniref:Ribonuclease E n=1 Tax=Alteripontixanthobacter maritimus TaxID=2161824 RepID=A0A369Q6G2_9SPHN|nr:ribonuclease E/G [Alteripontixanthobacter maritimus]RDC60062.1 Ribonuclease E [Alteripontixanthobacter maritimus]
MATRMLIDARHTEETRVAVLKGNRIEEFDFESAEHKQIKGNIYLAKVTRVEPSLQAAFVDFGGNRHGFLAFSEIHPDYYQIPKEDREALLAEDAEAAEEESRLRAEEEDEGHTPGDEYDADDESSGALAEDLSEDGMEEVDTDEKDAVATIEEGQVEGDDDAGDDDNDDDDTDAEASDDDGKKGRGRGRGRRQGRGKKGGKGSGGGSRAKQVDEVRARRQELRRRYKIQDVIQRRQVLLVQVVKEERGNKGAALTTYLSLAGRYTVLMPNSTHGGGISRKIANAGDRKRLKQVVGALDLPRSMGLIVRTAGLSRTKTEIKRDFDYLARVWDEIRENTLGSSAPALIHSDSDLIKRAIRDIYNREIEEVIVEGEAGYKSAKAFMKMLMPSHARRVKAYSDPVPLFQRYGAEDQLRAMYEPVVQLKSGGYLVINPTEALVSIDINSGRSTKEHGIEQTATATNLEAAREIARQLRLRDMAGLVVIDFIDMDYNNNVRKVERAMKDALKNDRARIQVGRISSFGLMEMSRQRLRTGVLEATTRECPHCDGTGLVRTASSAGLSALRLIEDEAAKGKGTAITLRGSTEAAVYLLNSKRAELQEIEDRYNVSIDVIPEGEDEGAKMEVGSSGPKPTEPPKFEPIVDDDDDDDDIEETSDEDEDEEDDNRRGNRGRGGRGRDDRNEDDDRPRKRRRRGGRGRNKNRDESSDDSDTDNRSDNDGENDANTSTDSNDQDEDGKPRKRRRRRGGRGRNRNRSDQDGQQDESSNDKRTVTSQDAEGLADVADQMQDDIAVVAGPDGAPETAEAAEAAQSDAKPKRKRAPRKKAASEGDDKSADDQAAEKTAEKPKAKRAPRKKKVEDEAGAPDTAAAPAEEKPKAKRAPRKKAAPKAAAVQTDSEQSASKDAAIPASAPSALKGDTKPADDKPAKPQEAAGATAPEGKPRRGWWQRTFGE